MTWESFIQELKKPQTLKDLKHLSGFAVDERENRVSFHPFDPVKSLAIMISKKRLNKRDILEVQRYDENKGPNKYTNLAGTVGIEDDNLLKRVRGIIYGKQPKGGVIHLVTDVIENANENERIRRKNWNTLFYHSMEDMHTLHALAAKHEVFVDTNLRIRDNLLRLEIEPVEWA